MRDQVDDTEEDVPKLSFPVRVRRRRVFYVSGFDPNGPRRYFGLYRTEAALQAGFSGYDITVGDAEYVKGGTSTRWTAAIEKDGVRSEAAIEMLRWDDIARKWMRRSLFSAYRLMGVTLWRYTAHGAFTHLLRIRAISTMVGMYPVAMMLLYLWVAGSMGYAVSWGAAALMDVSIWWDAPLGVLVFVLLMRATRLWDGALIVYYLICDFGFTAAHSEGEAEEMEQRIDAFAERVKLAWDEEDVDEILIVGHSSGSSYAASVCARAIRMGVGAGAGEGGRPVFSFLTLGQTIPMLSFLRGARRMREDLELLGRSDAVTWIDISSPADGACYALSDPVGVTGVAPPRRERRNPKVVSAAFWENVSPEMRAELGRRYFRIHIQYLCAFDRPAEFDYFEITAGSATLADRFAGRSESPKIIGAPCAPRFRD